MSRLLQEGGWPLAAIACASIAGWWIGCARLLAVLSERRSWNRGRSGQGLAGRIASELETLEGAAARRTLPLLLEEERRRLLGALPVVAGIATLCPLLGLLGTLLGMISTFRSILESGGLRTEAMATGISQALTTTQAGLLVSLPLILLHGHTSAAAERLLAELEGALGREVSP